MPIAKRIQRAFRGSDPSPIIRVGAGILGVFLFAVVCSRLIYPFDTGYLETFNWVPAMHLLEGKNPYSFAFTPPYSMVPYGIVYYALVAVGIKLFGLQMWWTRILSVLAFAVCVWAVVKITKKLTGSQAALWTAGLVSLAFFPVQAWIALMRSDLIALAFSFAAMGLAFTADKDKSLSWVRVVVIILLCSAAFFTKHTFLLPVGIIFLRFLQTGKWRAAVVFGASFSVLVSCGVLLLNYTSGGGYLWQHLTHARTLPYGSEKLWVSFLAMTTTPATIIFIIALLIFAYQRREFIYSTNGRELINLLKSPKTLIVFYLFLSFTAAVFSGGRVGASINYYLEASFVAAVVCALIYEGFREKATPALASAMIVLLTLGGVFQLVRLARGEYFRWQAVSYYREVSDTVAKYTRPGSVCFSIFAELVMRNGCALHFDDYGEYTTDWTPQLRTIFEKEVRAGRYTVIIWPTDNFQEQFPEYRLIRMSQSVPERFFPVYLYVRKAESAQ